MRRALAPALRALSSLRSAPPSLSHLRPPSSARTRAGALHAAGAARSPQSHLSRLARLTAQLLGLDPRLRPSTRTQYSLAVVLLSHQLVSTASASAVRLSTAAAVRPHYSSRLSTPASPAQPQHNRLSTLPPALPPQHSRLGALSPQRSRYSIPRVLLVQAVEWCSLPSSRINSKRPPNNELVPAQYWSECSSSEWGSALAPAAVNGHSRSNGPRASVLCTIPSTPPPPRIRRCSGACP
jgi:hypothetical protein